MSISKTTNNSGFLSTFARPFYPKEVLTNMKTIENEKYPIGTVINITDHNGDVIGYVRRCGFSDTPYWNGYLKINSKFLDYDDFNELFSKMEFKDKSNNIQEITYFQDNIIGWDHAHLWDTDNYTTLDIAMCEVMYMQEVCKVCKLL